MIDITDYRMHIPEPSIQRFEQQLGRFIGMQCCKLCGESLGNTPRVVSNKRMFHRRCWDFLVSTGVLGS